MPLVLIFLQMNACAASVIVPFDRSFIDLDLTGHGCKRHDPQVADDAPRGTYPSPQVANLDSEGRTDMVCQPWAPCEQNAVHERRHVEFLRDVPARRER